MNVCRSASGDDRVAACLSQDLRAVGEIHPDIPRADAAHRRASDRRRAWITVYDPSGPYYRSRSEDRYRQGPPSPAAAVDRVAWRHRAPRCLRSRSGGEGGNAGSPTRAPGSSRRRWRVRRDPRERGGGRPARKVGRATASPGALQIPTSSRPEFVRAEIAAGRAIIPANINHAESEPMIIGRNFLVKINANIGNSAVTSSMAEEVDKMVWAIPLGRGHGHGSVPPVRSSTRFASGSAQCARAYRHRADLPGAGEGRWHRREPELGSVPATRSWSRQSRASTHFTIHAGVRLHYIPLTASRVTGIVSRGGSIMAKWLSRASSRKLSLRAFRRDLRHLPRLRRELLARRRLGVPGSIADANDAAQFARAGDLG